LESEPKFLKGTTTIGLTGSDGVVLLADKRASMGNFIASKKAKKIHRINDKVAATIAGSVGDAESIIRLIQAEASLYEINNKQVMSPKAVASLMSNILQGSKYYPYMIQVLVGGLNKKSEVYTLDPLGGLIEEDMASTGCGSPVAYGVLELEYVENRPTKDNITIALRAMMSTLQRDSATGDGLSMVTITSEGFKQYTDEEIEELVKKLPRKAAK